MVLSERCPPLGERVHHSLQDAGDSSGGAGLAARRVQDVMHEQWGPSLPSFLFVSLVPLRPSQAALVRIVLGLGAAFRAAHHPTPQGYRGMVIEA